MALIIAERVTANSTHIFLIPQEIFDTLQRKEQQKTEFYNTPEVKRTVGELGIENLYANRLEERTLWLSRGPSQGLLPEHFSDEYLRWSHHKEYSELPILAPKAVHEFPTPALDGIVDAVTGTTHTDEMPFIKRDLREFKKKMLGRLPFTGELHLLRFRPDRYEGEDCDEERLLYFTPIGEPPVIRDGIVGFADGTAIDDTIYAEATVRMQMFSYNQGTEDRTRAPKGELSITPLGQLSLHRNAFGHGRTPMAKIGLITPETKLDYF